MIGLHNFLIDSRMKQDGAKVEVVPEVLSETYDGIKEKDDENLFEKSEAEVYSTLIDNIRGIHDEAASRSEIKSNIESIVLSKEEDSENVEPSKEEDDDGDDDGARSIKKYGWPDAPKGSQTCDIRSEATEWIALNKMSRPRRNKVRNGRFQNKARRPFGVIKMR